MPRCLYISKVLFEGLIFGGVYLRRKVCVRCPRIQSQGNSPTFDILSALKRIHFYSRFFDFFLRDSKASKTRAPVKITPREKGLFSRGVISRALAFRSLYYPWGKRGTTRSLLLHLPTSLTTTYVKRAITTTITFGTSVISVPGCGKIKISLMRFCFPAANFPLDNKVIIGIGRENLLSGCHVEQKSKTFRFVIRCLHPLKKMRAQFN